MIRNRIDLEAIVNNLSHEEKKELGDSIVEFGLLAENSKNLDKFYKSFFKDKKNKSKGKLSTIYSILQKTKKQALLRGLSTYMKEMNKNERIS